MDEQLTAELEALRAELEEDEATAVGASAPVEEPRPEVGRPRPARLVSDLLAEVADAKKR